MMTGPYVVYLSGLALMMAVWAIGSLVVDISNPSSQAIRQRIRSVNRKWNPSQTQSIFTELSELNLDTANDGRHQIWVRLLVLIDQSDSRLTIGKFLLFSAFTGAGTAMIAALIKPHSLFIGVGSLAGILIPYSWLCLKRSRRLATLRSQLPEAFDMMRRAVRSGRTMQMAMQLVAKECPPLIAKEFARCCEQHDLGLSQEVSLREMARRNDIMEFRIFVVAMLVQRISGGNPIELLDNLSQRVRSRKRLADRVKALTSEGRMQALVLYVLPIAAFVAIYLLDRNYAQILLDRPKLIGTLVVAQIVGALWINKVVNFDY